MSTWLKGDWSTGGPSPSEEQINFWEETKLKVSRIYPRLYIGGYPGPEVQLQLKEHEVTFIVSTSISAPPDIHFIPVVRYPFSDNYAALPDMGLVRRAAVVANEAYLSNHCVYIHCAYGLNRSALVAAFVLNYLTEKPGSEIIELLRSARPGSLHNPAYEQIVRSLDSIEILSNS